MFLNNVKNSLKILFKNKPLVFWTFAFPLILATLFNMAFSNIEKNETLDIINIGIVNDENYSNNMMYSTVFNYLSDENNSDRLFNITYNTKEELDKKLDKEKIIGYLYLDDKPNVVIEKNGINQSIFKYVVDEIEMTFKAYADTSSLEEAMSLFSSKVDDYIYDSSSKNMSYTMIEFYSLIAMTCLYGAMLGMYLINQALPNMSNKGKRVAVSPIPKMKLILSSLCASYIAQLIGLLLLFLYTCLFLNINYGDNLLLVVVTALVGSLAGLSFGLFVASAVKSNENTKLGIIISVTMAFSFLAGMMGIVMKYMIDKSLPILNMINPVNMITDALYSLYYYETLSRFYFNIGSLLIFSFVLILLSYLALRRQKYDSI